jgi:hypothetical protein
MPGPATIDGVRMHQRAAILGARGDAQALHEHMAVRVGHAVPRTNEDRLIRVYLAASRGATAEARAHLAPLTDGLDHAGRDSGWLTRLAQLAHACCLSDDRRSGARVAAILERHEGEHCLAGVHYYGGAVDYYRGHLANLAGDLDAAVQLFEAGITAHEHAGAALFEAPSRYYLARALERRGRPRDRQDAQHHLARAHEQAARIGARLAPLWGPRS